MTIIIDSSILWFFAFTVIWLFLGATGLLMINRTTRTPKWDCWQFILLGPIMFFIGLVFLWCYP